MARSTSVVRRLAPLLTLLLVGGACGESEDPSGSGGSGGSGASGPGDGGAGGQAAADAQPPDNGSDPNDPYACTGPGQCLLRDAARNCCMASCGEQTIDFFTAIHYDHAGTWYEGQVCAGCLEPCSEEDRLAFTRSTSGIIAVCTEGRCEPFDARVSDVTSCASDDDCELRYGWQCCEDLTGNPEILTAVSDRNLLKDLTCQEQYTPCGARPSYPESAHAVCGASGHCEVVVDAPDAGDAASSPDAAEAGQAPGPDASDAPDAP